VARRLARELAFRTLFQAERGHAEVMQSWQQVKDELAADDTEVTEVYGGGVDTDAVSFAERLLQTFVERRELIDTSLAEIIEGWSFTQMAQTDLNVLRLALTELWFEPDIPKEVTIEMAVRIAKKFGGEESGRFVNGVLARLNKQPSSGTTVG
jgi:transcription antitermination protein NusB